MLVWAVIVSWRIVPLAALLLFYAIAFGWRTWLHIRRYGGPAFALFRSGRRSQHVREALILVLPIVLLAQAFVEAVAPEYIVNQKLLGPEAEAWARVVGVLLFAAAIVFTVVAQLDLGASWRVGIEEGARPGLVTGGLFAFCRNPIFLGMFVALAAYALLLPTWLSLLCVLAAVAGVRRQVIEEESYLLRTYGADYRAYASRVGRFVPRVGRLG